MKTGTRKCALAIGAVITASIGVGMPVMAQTPEPKTSTMQSSDIAEIIVTARRTEERLQDVPISITVFNQEQLTKANIVNAESLAGITPSLSSNNNFGSENATFAIRGFVQDAGTPPSVGTYFADVVALRGPTQGTQAGDGAGPGSFFDLQNVQVLKGPQGTLFGRNTTGGAVLFVPQKPTGEFGGYVEGSYGNFDMTREQGAINVPFSDDIRFRLAADHQQRDGYLNNISGIGPKHYNDIDYTAVRASLVWDITANLENYTIASYSKSDTNGSVQKLLAANPVGFSPVDPSQLQNFIGIFSSGQLADQAARGGGFYDVQTAVANPVQEVEQKQVINTTTWSLNDTLTLKNIASYGEYKNFQRSQLFGTNWQLSTLPAVYSFAFFQGIPAIFSGIFPAPGLNTADQSTYTEEVQLQGSAWDRRLTYQAGFYLEWSDPLNPVGNQSQQLASCVDLATFNCSDPIGATFTAGTAAQLAAFGVPPPYPAIHIGAVNYTVGETTFRNRGAYAQSTLSMTDQLKLTVGVRGTWDEQRNTATRITRNFPVPGDPTTSVFCTDPGTAPSCTETLSKKSNKPTGLVGLDYKPTDDVLLYGKYARGYRAGGVFANAPVDHRTFEPEKVDSFEIGTKTSFFEPVRGLFNATVFYNKFSNQQLQLGFNPFQFPNGATAPVAPTTAIINAGKSRIYGAEVEASILPMDGLSLDVSYTYLNATIRSIAPISTSDPNYELGAGGAPVVGSPLVLSPKNKFTAAANYVLPLSDTIGRVSVGATFIHTDEQQVNYAYQGAVASSLGNYGVVGNRDLLNLNMDWKSVFGSTVDLSLFGTNVTQKQYIQFVAGLGLVRTGTESGTVGEPRMYGMRVRYNFGQ